nr:nephrin isoform X2 [Halyomorpha halys]
MMDPVLLTFLFLFNLVNAQTTSETAEFQKNLPAEVIWAQEGGDAELPCDVEPSAPGDRINMILWFKDSTGIPLYSVDGRYGGLERASHGAMVHDLGQRSNFDRGPPARLRISKVKKEDQGVFRCRVDFLNSPTRNYRVNLTLITPSAEPKIYNPDENVELKDIAGPYRISQDIRLVCIVSGGNPTPNVSWWLDNKMLESNSELKISGNQVSRLQLGGANKHLHGHKLSCQAKSADHPVTTTLVIRIFLRPNKVEIVSPEEMFSAGQTKQVVCEAYGSYPAANLTWFLDGDLINYLPISVISIGNTTRSTLNLKPIMEDDGKELTCRAVNPKYPSEYIETRRTISVAYPATAEVEILSGPMGGNHLREGETIKLGCKVKSNPPPDKILWYHESELLRENGGELNLGPVNADYAGDYFCFVRNREGAVRSRPLSLKVQYAPFCKPGTEVRTVGAMVGSTVKASCEVQVASEEDLKFRWTFNRSREVMAIPSASVHSSGSTSYVSYKANTEYDFGTLACWSTNSVGHQKNPCIIHLALASLPKKPEDCNVQNKTRDRLEIECTAGDDGGLPQQFLLQVLEEGQLTPSFKLFSLEPKFKLPGLEPNKRYDLHIYAKNSLGLSEGAVIISGVSGPAATEKLTGRGKDSQTDYWLLGGVGGMAGIALLASVLTYLACRKKQKREDVPLNNLGPSVRIRYPGENNSDYYND